MKDYNVNPYQHRAKFNETYKLTRLTGRSNLKRRGALRVNDLMIRHSHAEDRKSLPVALAD